MTRQLWQAMVSRYQLAWLRCISTLISTARVWERNGMASKATALLPPSALSKPPVTSGAIGINLARRGSGGKGGTVSPPPPPPPPAGTSWITSFTQGSIHLQNAGFFIGSRFTVAGSPLTAIAVGRWRFAGNAGVINIGLYDPSGNVVSATTIDMGAGPSGQFSYADLPAPVVLLSNMTYVVASLENGVNLSALYSDSVITTTADANQNTSCYANSSGGVPSGGFLDEGGPVSAEPPCNFLYHL